MTIRHVNNAEDYKDWRADKGLHDAYVLKQELQKTHSNADLERMWVEHEQAEGRKRARKGGRRV